MGEAGHIVGRWPTGGQRALEGEERACLASVDGGTPICSPGERQVPGLWPHHPRNTSALPQPCCVNLAGHSVLSVRKGGKTRAGLSGGMISSASCSLLTSPAPGAGEVLDPG